MDVRKDWYWEGNVVKMIVRFLSAENWESVSMADAFLKQRGPDIHPGKVGRSCLWRLKATRQHFTAIRSAWGRRRRRNHVRRHGSGIPMHYSRLSNFKAAIQVQ
jgi:hypothetical protein